jgi:sulfotransferase family protein
LFLMGNKRSGTRLLVQLLNLNPKVFVSDESDIIWILYQLYNGMSGQLRCYPWDGPVGLDATVKAANHVLESFLHRTSEKGSVFRTFLSVQEHLMRYGSSIQQPYNKTNLAWIGDKKPVQHSDPELRAFIRKNLPNARYIHILRDPRYVVTSMIRALRDIKPVPHYWRKAPLELFDRWASHEEWVLQAKTMEGNVIHTLRLEDLCKEPVKEMAGLFNFLELDMPQGIADQVRALIGPNPNRKYESFQLPVPQRVAKIMKLYGYHFG